MHTLFECTVRIPAYQIRSEYMHTPVQESVRICAQATVRIHAILPNQGTVIYTPKALPSSTSRPGEMSYSSQPIKEPPLLSRERGIFVPSLHHMIKEKEIFKIYITLKGVVSDAGMENIYSQLDLYFVRNYLLVRWAMYGKDSLENKITQKGVGSEE